jgi:signal transduction histidine kinase
VHLIWDLPAELVVDVHTGAMLQVISNVIGNALDALPQEGTLHLGLRRHQEEVHLMIAYNGHGSLRKTCEKYLSHFSRRRGSKARASDWLFPTTSHKASAADTSAQ